jgi:hypothetical protein
MGEGGVGGQVVERCRSLEVTRLSTNERNLRTASSELHSREINAIISPSSLRSRPHQRNPLTRIQDIQSRCPPPYFPVHRLAHIWLAFHTISRPTYHGSLPKIHTLQARLGPRPGSALTSCENLTQTFIVVWVKMYTLNKFGLSHMAHTLRPMASWLAPRPLRLTILASCHRHYQNFPLLPQWVVASRSFQLGSVGPFLRG